jgi:lysophospholipase L1-like esterase
VAPHPGLWTLDHFLDAYPPPGFRRSAHPPASPKVWLQFERGRFDATSGGSNVTADVGAIARLEDQSGNGNHFTQATSGERPIFDASRGFVLSSMPNDHYFDVPASFTFDRRAFSLFLICSLTNLRRGLTPAGGLGANHIIARSASDSCNLYYPGAGTSADAWKLTVFNGSTKPIGIIPYTTDLTLIGFVGRTTGCEGWVRNQMASISPLTSGNSTLESLLGWTPSIQPLQANIRDVFFYDRALTSDEITKTLWNYALSRGIPPGQSGQLVFVGDSITHGHRQTKNRNWPSLLTGLHAVYKRVTAESSITLQDLNTQSARDISLLRAGETNVIVLFAGTNDIALAGATGTTTHTRLSTLATAYQGAGYRVIVVKMVDRGDFNATQDGYRNDFNNAVDANWNTYANAMFDPMADNAAFGNASSVLFDADQIHFSDSGAATFAAGIQPVIVEALSI